MKSLTDLQEKILINLSKREQLSTNDMVWIVKTASNLGTDDAKAAAAELIEKIVDKANNDQGFAKEIEKAKPALQSLGATIQAEHGNYDKAKELIDQLIEAYPRKSGAARLAGQDPHGLGSQRIRPSTARPSPNGTRLRKKLERISTAPPRMP